MGLNKRLKIAILSPFYPLRGGIAQFGDNLADALEKDHVVLRVNFKRQYPSLLFPGKSQEVETIEPTFEKSVRLIDSINPLSYIRTAKVLRSYNPDLVITTYWMPFMVFAFAGILKRIKGGKAKRIILVHNFISHQAKPFEKKLSKWLLIQNDEAVVLSQNVKEQIIDTVPDFPVRFIPHPVYKQFGSRIDQNEARIKLGIPLDKKVLLFFGLVRPYKGLDVLVQSFVELNEEYYLLIAGECYGSNQVYIEAMGKRNPLTFKWIDHFIPDQMVATFFSACDVCVLPYKSATQSGVTAVAHHFNIPVIATEVGGIAETVRHEVNGLLVPPNQPKALRDAILAFFQQNLKEEFTQSLIQNEGLDWSDFAHEIVEK